MIQAAFHRTTKLMQIALVLSTAADQEQHLLVKLWPPGSLGSFTLNSNHEMYSGAKPYFNAHQPAAL